MKFKIPVHWFVFSGMTIASLSYVGYTSVSRSIASHNGLLARQHDLKTVAKHKASDTCWKLPDKTWKIGDAIATEGSEEGKVPTGCFLDKNQVVYGAYQNGSLQVKHIFSYQELQNELSQLRK